MSKYKSYINDIMIGRKSSDNTCSIDGLQTIRLKINRQHIQLDGIAVEDAVEERRKESAVLTSKSH